MVSCFFQFYFILCIELLNSFRFILCLGVGGDKGYGFTGDFVEKIVNEFANQLELALKNLAKEKSNAKKHTKSHIPTVPAPAPATTEVPVVTDTAQSKSGKSERRTGFSLAALSGKDKMAK